MKISTQEDVQLNFNGEFKPRALTLDIIRQVGYTYRPNVTKALSLN